MCKSAWIHNIKNLNLPLTRLTYNLRFTDRLETEEILADHSITLDLSIDVFAVLKIPIKPV